METNYGFENIIKNVSKIKVAVLGDAMLDVYARGSSDRLAREAPVPVVDLKSRSFTPGGAANTAFNVASLGVESVFFSVIGKDKEGEILFDELKKRCVNVENVIFEKGRLTLTKERVLSNSQITLRLDSGTKNEIGRLSEDKLIENLSRNLPYCQALIISDYNYGVLTPRIHDWLFEFKRNNKIIIGGDAKDLKRFKIKFTFVKPSYKEALALLDLKEEKADKKRIFQIKTQGPQIFKLINSDAVAVTLDKAGAVLIENNNDLPYHTFAKPVPGKKTVGAGDTYIAAFIIALASGSSFKEAAEFAALVCKIAVKKDGTTFCTLDEIKKSGTVPSKIIENREILKSLTEKLSARGKRIVFTNGCFDILHSGHVTFLRKAKALGDILIVGVNSDESVRALKGETRPINKIEDRLNVLAGLDSVDYLISFAELTPINLIKIVKPDVFTKGGDYSNKVLPEAEILKNLGSKIVILPLVENRSTTGIIKKIQDQNIGKKILNQINENQKEKSEEMGKPKKYSLYKAG